MSVSREASGHASTAIILQMGGLLKIEDLPTVLLWSTQVSPSNYHLPTGSELEGLLRLCVSQHLDLLQTQRGFLFVYTS